MDSEKTIGTSILGDLRNNSDSKGSGALSADIAAKRNQQNRDRVKRWRDRKKNGK